MTFCRSGLMVFIHPERVPRTTMVVHYGEAPRAAASFNQSLSHFDPIAYSRLIRFMPLKTICFRLLFLDRKAARALGVANPPDGVRLSVPKEASILLSTCDLVLPVGFEVCGPEIGVVAAWMASRLRRRNNQYNRGKTLIFGQKTGPTDEELLRLMQEAIDGQKRKQPAKRGKAAAPRAKNQSVRKALKQLINALDKVFEKNEELGDTAVREELHDAVRNGFIMPQPRYKLPAKFGMFSDHGDKLVRMALERFMAHPEIAEASKSIKTPAARLAAFQDAEVESSEGNLYDEYFGHADKP